MIALEAREGKYDKRTHAARFAAIEQNWDAIVRILDEELPASGELERMMRAVGLPTSCAELGVDRACARTTFRA